VTQVAGGQGAKPGEQGAKPESQGAKPESQGAKLWGGRFAGEQDPRFETFNRSLPFDRRLWAEDVVGSIAWAGALHGAGVLTAEEAKGIVGALEAIGAELDRDPSPLASSTAEDVHAFVEAALFARVGDLAKKLHTGRSRNDQVATDLKLWCRAAGASLEAALAEAMTALVAIAERHAATPMPGYTHLQRAQVVTAGHHALAYVEMLERDRTRIVDALARMDTCPLGSGALAGTAFAIDREELAASLGFGSPTSNSLDAVSDRDHVSELAFACAMVGVHLSRLAEDWIFFASTEARFLAMSDAISTGSSLMPQKKNPDALELLRGKCGRLVGRLVGTLVMQKGIPLAYDKDLQEDKEALFEVVDTTRECLAICAIVARNVEYDARRCLAESSKGHLNATDLADLLVRRGTPFRHAHELAGRAVRLALERGCEVEGLPKDVRDELMPQLADISDAQLGVELSPQACLARRAAHGGTSPARVVEQVELWKERLASWNSPS
jgi:argininosuccinate lyase